MRARYLLSSLLAVIVISSVVVGGYYWWVVDTPGYAFGKLARASRTRDVTTFERYADLEGTAFRLFDDLVAYKEQESMAQESSLAESLGSLLVRAIKPTVVNVFQDQVRRLVEEGRFENLRFEGATKPSVEEAGLLPALSERLGANQETLVDTQAWQYEGKTAVIGLVFHHRTYEDDFVVKLKFRDVGWHWQLAEFSNVSEVLYRLEELERNHLEKLEAERQERLRQEEERRVERLRQERERLSAMSPSELLDILPTRKRSRGDKLLFDLLVRNHTHHVILEYEAYLSITGTDGNLVKHLRIRNKDRIPADASVSQTWERLIINDPDQELARLSDAAIIMEASVARLVLDNGAESKVPGTFQDFDDDRFGTLDRTR